VAASSIDELSIMFTTFEGNLTGADLDDRQITITVTNNVALCQANGELRDAVLEDDSVSLVLKDENVTILGNETIPPRDIRRRRREQHPPDPL